MSSHSSQFVYHLGRLLQYAADVACSAWFRSCCFCYDVSSLPCFQFCPAVSYEATVLSVLLTLGLPCNIAVWNLPTAPLYCPVDVNRVQSVGLVRTYVRTWKLHLLFCDLASEFRVPSVLLSVSRSFVVECSRSVAASYLGPFRNGS